MTPDMPLALARESAGGQIAQRNDDHDHADQPQAVAADFPARGQGDHAEREDDSAQPQVTEPVGNDTETEYLGDGGHIQTERSEEHTSELQSRPHLVCRLLLEKKKI